MEDYSRLSDDELLRRTTGDRRHSASSTTGVERKGAAFFGSSHGVDQRTYQLIVAGEVESIRPLGDGDWTVKMTPPWTPRARGARPLRPVVAIDDKDLLDIDRVNTLLPELKLGYANGRTRVARP